MILYLTGGADWNAGAVVDLERAQKRLEAAGAVVLMPVLDESTDGRRENIETLTRAEGVVLLPHWPGSPTSLLVTHVALALGLECWSLDVWLEKIAEADRG